MEKGKIYNIFVFLLIIGTCFLYFKGHLNKVLYPDDYFLTCTDFGQYAVEVKDYLVENTHFIDLVKVGEEPGLFIVASNLGRIANIPDQSILTILSMVMYCLLGSVLFLLGVKFAGKNKKIVGIICVIFYISLYGTIYSQLSGIWRQVLGSIFFLIFLLYSDNSEKRGYAIIQAISFSMFTLSHRIFTIVGIAIFGFILARSLLVDRKQIKKYLYIFIAIGILCMPYLLLYYEYVVHYLEYLHIVESSGPLMRGDFLQQSSKYLGYSFYGPSDDRTAIVHYFFYLNYILIICIAFVKKTLLRINKIYIFTFLFLLFYVSFKIDFSVRILLLFELIIVPILALNVTYNYSRFIQIFIVLGVFLVGFVKISNHAIPRIPAREFDEGINFLLSAVDKKEKNFFMGSPCSSDLLSQLGLTNYFNIHMSLHNIREKKRNQEPDMYDAEGIIKTNIVFLKREGTVLDYFKDKGQLYIVFTEIDRAEVELIKSGKSDLLGKEYLTLFYPQQDLRPGSGMIKYIFKINTDLIKYSDTKAYMMENIRSFNLK